MNQDRNSTGEFHGHETVRAPDVAAGRALRFALGARVGRGTPAGARMPCISGAVLALVFLLTAGCTRESTRIAIESHRRADQVQQAVFDQQHETLRILLYRDLGRRLETDSRALSAAQLETLSEVWNDRDLIEFWAVQHERAKALRLLGVDAKLFGDQSVVDLLAKSVEARVDRAEEGVAAWAGAEAAKGE